METPAKVGMGMIARHYSLKSVRVATVAWLLTSVYYFYQYALRSAPAVMMPELSNDFNISALSVASIVGLFYYGYSPFSLLAGAAMDRIGPRRLLPGAAFIVGIGALLFSSGDTQLASVGRFLQGAGGVFALVGAIYIATPEFPTFTGRYLDWCYADVWRGRKFGRPVCGWTTYRSWTGMRRI